MAIEGAQIFLSITCGLFIVASFVINFSFLITLMKLRRLNRSDKSNFFLTHLIFADFLCAWFILIPSGFGIYNGNYLDMRACHVQVYFVSFFFSITFYGLLALSIERYIKYKYPLTHINFFTQRSFGDNEETAEVSGRSICHKTVLILLALWILNIFIGLIPLFGNINDLQYFVIESACDYKYENFKWWLHIYFWFSIVVPFLASIVFFILTFRLIFQNEQIIRNRQAKVSGLKKARSLNGWSYFCDLLLPRRARKLNAAERYVNNMHKDKPTHRAQDTTKLPENLCYYAHLINIETLDDGQCNIYNDLHVRKQLLVQFKYDTERSKTASFFLIAVLSFLLVFPVYVIHFYRTYSFDGVNADNTETVARRVYTTFVMLSFLTLIVKASVCMIHNKFYRYSLYQSANFRGFHGDYDYEVQKFKREIHQFEALFEDNNKQSRTKKKHHTKLINEYEN